MIQTCRTLMEKWTPSHGWANAGQPARTYIQQLCADTGCSLEEQPGEMDNRDGCRERVREICAGGVTWWWCTLRVPPLQALTSRDINSTFKRMYQFEGRSCVCFEGLPSYYCIYRCTTVHDVKGGQLRVELTFSL